MPDDPPASIGAFTYGTARLSSYEGVELAKSGRLSAITAVYTVVLADPSTVPTTSAVSGLPEKGDSFSSTDKWLVADAPKLERTDPTSGVWEARVEYKRSGVDTGASAGADEGNIEALRFGWTSNNVDLVSSKSAAVAPTDSNTYYAKPAESTLVNTAGDPYDGTVQVDNADLTITFVRREKVVQDTKLGKNGTVNDDEITIFGFTFAKHTAKVGIEVEDTLADDTYRFRYTYTVTVRHNYVEQSAPFDLGWDLPVLECGWRFKETTGGITLLKRFTDTDENGRKVAPSCPQLLGTDGTPAGTGGRKVSVYGPYAEASWTDLKLPASLPSVQEAANG